MAIWFLAKILRVIPLITKVVRWGKGQSLKYDAQTIGYIYEINKPGSLLRTK